MKQTTEKSNMPSIGKEVCRTSLACLPVYRHLRDRNRHFKIISLSLIGPNSLAEYMKRAFGKTFINYVKYAWKQTIVSIFWQ